MYDKFNHPKLKTTFKRNLSSLRSLYSTPTTAGWALSHVRIIYILYEASGRHIKHIRYSEFDKFQPRTLMERKLPRRVIVAYRIPDEFSPETFLKYALSHYADLD